MKMKIDDYIKIIKSWLYKGTDGLTNTKLGYMEGWFHKTDKEAFETAIEIMRKYKKIEEILDQLIDSKIRTYDAVTEIEDIVYGQVEADNGNDD